MFNLLISNLANPTFDNDQLIKMSLSTPIILDVISNKFYDSLFMSIPVKWQYDILKYIDVEIDIQENIKLHQYFKLNLKIKNLVGKKILLDLEIGDSISENHELCLTNLNNKYLENNL